MKQNATEELRQRAMNARSRIVGRVIYPRVIKILPDLASDYGRHRIWKVTKGLTVDIDITFALEQIAREDEAKIKQHDEEVSDKG